MTVSSKHTVSLKTVLLACVKLLLVVAAFYYLYHSGKINIAKLQIAYERPLLFSCAAVLFFAGALVAVERWRCLLRAQGVWIGYVPAFKLTLVGYFFSTFLPGGVTGDLIKGYYFSKGSNNKTELFLSLAAERILGVYTIILFSAVPVVLLYMAALFGHGGVVGNVSLKMLLLFIVVLFTVLTVVLALPFVSPWAVSFVKAILSRFFPHSHVMQQVAAVFEAYVCRPKLVVAALLYSCLSQVLLCLGMSLIAVMIGVEFSVFEYAFVTPVCFFINNVAITPAGIGVGEVGFAAVFSLFGSAQGANVAILFHVISLFLTGVIGGAVYFLSDMQGLRRVVHGEEAQQHVGA